MSGLLAHFLLYYIKLGQMSVATPLPQFLSILRAGVATNFAGVCEVFFTGKLNLDSNTSFEFFNVASITLFTILAILQGSGSGSVSPCCLGSNGLSTLSRKSVVFLQFSRTERDRRFFVALSMLAALLNRVCCSSATQFHDVRPWGDPYHRKLFLHLIVDLVFRVPSTNPLC